MYMRAPPAFTREAMSKDWSRQGVRWVRNSYVATRPRAVFCGPAAAKKSGRTDNDFLPGINTQPFALKRMPADLFVPALRRACPRAPGHLAATDRVYRKRSAPEDTPCTLTPLLHGLIITSSTSSPLESSDIHRHATEPIHVLQPMGGRVGGRWP